MSVKSVRCRQCNAEFAPENLGNCANCQGILQVLKPKVSSVGLTPF
jgi:threonine synthase